MTTRPILACLLLALGLSSGCAFWKRDGKPKESSAIAAEVEASFRERWIERRAAELVTRGEAPDYARGQAAREFEEKFEFNERRKK